MLNKVVKTVVAATLAITMAGSAFAEASYTHKPNQGLANIIGAIVGGTMASNMTKGKKNQTAATILGALVGASIAGNAAKSKDQAEAVFYQSDDVYMERTGFAALNTGQRQEWYNPSTGSKGVMQPSQLYYAYLSGSQEVCRTLNTHSIRNNIPSRGQIVACQANGTWERRK